MIIKVGEQYINLDHVDHVNYNPYGMAVRLPNQVLTLTNADADFFRGVVDALHAITVQSINSKLLPSGIAPPEGPIENTDLKGRLEHGVFT